MNTKGTEMSIFQGAPSIHVDNNQQRLEEAEAEQDRIRRNAELNGELQNAFSDLEECDEADESMNSTRFTNGTSYHQKSKSYAKLNQFQPQKPFSLRKGEVNLQNTLESKAREIEYVTSQLTSERKEHKRLIDEYEKRLSIAESEKERALMSRQQEHELLVENKGRSRELEENNEKLRSKIRSLETENSSLVSELENTKLMLSEVQIKYSMVEKNVTYTADRNTDAIVKQAQEKHSAQITMMQQQIEGLKAKYEGLEHDHKNLSIRYNELQRSRESMLIEKSEVVNQLNKNLEDAQRQCQELLSRPNFSQENRQLQSLVRSMESDKEEKDRTISKLQKRINEQTKEMELMDSIVQECGGNNFSFSESTKFMQREPLKNVNSSIPLPTEARLARVKEELCKSLNNIKNKREEIKIYEQQLREKDDEIKQLKSGESNALHQMNQFRNETIRLESKMKILEKELDRVRQESLQKSDNHTCITDAKYEQQITRMTEEKEALDDELNSLKAEYENLCMKNSELKENENELRGKMKQLEMQRNSSSIVSELEEERLKVEALEKQLKCLNIEKVDQAVQIDEAEDQQLSGNQACEKCDEYLVKLEKFELSCLQLHNTNVENLTTLQKVKQELSAANREVKNLQEKLNLKQVRDEEIEKLKEKAQEFGEFMKTNSRSLSATSTRKSSLTSTKTDVSTETSGLGEDNSRLQRETETKIRDEMAKIFAAEAKSIEKRFREEIERLKVRLHQVSKHLEETSQELEVRNVQAQQLRWAILQEREEHEKLVTTKDNDFKIAIEKYRAEYENNQQRIEDLMAQLSENKEMIDGERLSIESLKRQMKEERASLARREEEAINKLKNLEHESSKTISELNEKYLTAKRTALNYKQYSEDKETHFRKEYEREKAAFREAFEKVKKEAKESLSETEKDYQERMRKMEMEFKFKLEILKEVRSSKY